MSGSPEGHVPMWRHIARGNEVACLCVGSSRALPCGIRLSWDPHGRVIQASARASHESMKRCTVWQRRTRTVDQVSQ